MYFTGWWLNQPIWKVFVKLDHSPGGGEDKKRMKPPRSSMMKFYFIHISLSFDKDDTGHKKNVVFQYSSLVQTKWCRYNMSIIFSKSTPLNINGWNLNSSPNWKGNFHLDQTSIFWRFKPFLESPKVYGVITWHNESTWFQSSLCLPGPNVSQGIKGIKSNLNLSHGDGIIWNVTQIM